MRKLIPTHSKAKLGWEEIYNQVLRDVWAEMVGEMTNLWWMGIGPNQLAMYGWRE